MESKDLTPTLTIKAPANNNGVVFLTPYANFWLSRGDWDALCDDIITAYKDDPNAYELYKATR